MARTEAVEPIDPGQAPLMRATLLRLAPDRAVDVPLYWQQWKLDFPALAVVAEAVASAAADALEPAPRS